ncbi:hypothetical protein FQZ97_798710 [compost metagenome]
MPDAERRLLSASSAKLRPDNRPQARPTVPWSARSNEGVTSTSPAVTSPSSIHSAGRTRSRKIRPSKSVMKAGKLAKPSVAMAMPPTLTEMKNVTQCPASRAPATTSTNSCAGVREPSSGLRRMRAKSPSEMTAKTARPKVITAALAWISSPNTPVSPKSTAAMWI